MLDNGESRKVMSKRPYPFLFAAAIAILLSMSNRHCPCFPGWFLVVLVVVLGHAHKVEESLGAASGRQQQGTAATTNQ